MNARDPVMLVLMFSVAVPSALASTPWERWIERPEPTSAKLVQKIEYSVISGNADIGEATTRDLRTLATRVGRGDSESVAIAVRIARTTPAGANLEDIYSILGVAAGDDATRFLTAVKREGSGKSCPGISFLGEKFVDDEAARAAELDRRKRAIMKVTSNWLMPTRDLCLKELQHDG
jgi:hypothetical protein